MNWRKSLAWLLLAWMVAAACAAGQQPPGPATASSPSPQQSPTPPDASPTEPPVYIDTFRIGAAEKQVTELARRGYRVNTAWATSTERLEWKDIVPGLPKGGLRLTATKVAVPPDNYSYRFIYGDLKMSTMQKHMDAAAADGYWLIPGGWMVIEQKVLGIPGATFLAIMEKPPHDATRYHYRVLRAYRRDNLEKQFQDALAAGFHPRQKDDYGEVHFAVLEKQD